MELAAARSGPASGPDIVSAPGCAPRIRKPAIRWKMKIFFRFNRKSSSRTAAMLCY
jgi:hypothetical protein